jgi:hypothetical protein
MSVALNIPLLPCAYRDLLGIDCPLCGFQRSLLLLLQGDWLKSFLMYPPLLPVLSLLAFVIVQRVFRNRIQLKYVYRLSAAVLGVVMLNYSIKILTAFQ